MHPEDERLYLLLDRYLAGEATTSDVEAVREWLAADAEHPLLLQDLQLLKRLTADTAPATNTDAAWSQAVRRLQPTARRVWRRVLIGALAAAAVLVALISARTVLRRAPAWNEYATTAAHRAAVRLQDGTQLTLAPLSRIRYTADYGRANRDVYLDGQAYFQVAHDERRPPFRVHTAGSVTEDLGTAFAVRAYAEQRATEVIVVEGRVALWRADTAAPSRARVPGSDPRPGLVLGALDLGRIDSSGVATSRGGVDVRRYLAWTRGVLAFDGTPLGDVVLTLERWYNVQIHLVDAALGARRLTATFSNEPIDLVMKRIALTLGVRVERAAGSVFVLRDGR